MLLCGVSIAGAQQTRQILFKRSERAVKGGSALLSTVKKIALDVDMSRFHDVAGPTLKIGALPLAEGVTVDLDLQEFSVLSGDAVVTVTGDRGPVAVRPTVKIYRGTVPGDPTSSAYLAFSDEGVTGGVTSGGKEFEIGTDLAAPSRRASVAAYSYAVADAPGVRIGCGLADNDPSLIGEGYLMRDQLLAAATKSRGGLLSAAGDSVLYTVKGAFDADYEFYQLFGRDSMAAINYMVATIGRMSEIYERDLKTQVLAGYLNVWTTANDPYTAYPVMQNALYESRDYWKADKAHQKIERGFTHVFSNKGWSGTIGIAFLNVICINDASYSFSLQTRDNPRQDVFVLCHEVGHNFGSKHTHDCSWNPEIDRCAAAEGGNCFSPAQVTQSQGTIMSYCAQTDLKFHQKCIDTLRKYLQIPNACVTVSRKLSVRRTQIDMPQVKLNTQIDSTLSGFLYNASRYPVVISGISKSGENMDRVTILTKDELPITLQPGESHDLKIRYLSPDENASIGGITFEHDAQNPWITVAFQAYSFDASPLLTLSSDQNGEIDWGKNKVGVRADTIIKNLYANAGRSPLNVTKTEIVGRDRFEFQIMRGSAPFTLSASGGRMPATLRFAPLTPGPKEAWLRIESDSRTGADSIKLVGEAEQGPLLLLKVSNLTVNFGKCQKNTSYDTLFTEFFFNAGTDTLEVQPIIAGPNGDAFTVNLGLVSVKPGTGLDLPITFFDGTDGYKTAYMVIYTNTPRAIDTVFLVAQIGEVTSAVPAEPVHVARVTIAPNPTAGTASALILPLDGEVGRPYSLLLTDPLGREAGRVEGTMAAGENRVELPLGSLPSGRYGVTITTALGRRSTTVTVVR